MAAAPWLLLGLLRAACALTSPPATTPGRGATPSVPPPATPIRNLRLEPARRRLSWDVVGDDVIAAGSRFLCQKGRGGPLRADPGGRSCSFPTLSRCHVTEFKVFPEDRKDLAASIRFPDPHPNPGSAARDLRCWVHHVDRLACQWGRGLGATDEVRYRMFWRDTRLGPDRDRECPHYDDSGLGCDLKLPTLDPSTNPHPTRVVMVTVNGSEHGGVARGVACNDLAVDLVRAEVLAPPTLEAECNASEAWVRWVGQSWFHAHLEFTLDVNQSSRPWNTTLFATEQRIPHPGPSLSVRVRARSADGWKVSGWSPTLTLACDPGATPVTSLTWPTLAGVGAGLTAMVATSLLLLHWRKPRLLARLFPPIPRMRVRMEAPGEAVAWAEAPEDCEVTPVMDDNA